MTIAYGSATRTTVFRSPQELGAHWDLLDTRNFYLSSAWFRCVDGSLGQESAFVLLEDAGRPVGMIAAYLVTDEAFFFQDPPGLALTEGGLKKDVEPFRTDDERQRVADLRAMLAPVVPDCYPVAVCVSPYSFCVAASPLGGRIFELLLDQFQALASEWNTQTSALLYFPQERQKNLAQSLEARGFVRSLIGAHAVLDVRWPDFDGYLKSLNGRRRNTVRRELRGFRESGLRLEAVDGSALAAIAPDLAVLSAKLMRKYGHGFDVERELLTFRLIETHLTPNVRLFVVRKRERPVAFAHVYERGDVLYAAMAAQDYDEIEPGDFAHFRAAYYAPIELAIELGAREINFGLGGYETKVNRGCRLRLLEGFFDFSRVAGREVDELLTLEDAAHRRMFERYRPPRAAPKEAPA